LKTPVEVLLNVARIGGRLSVIGDKLRVLLPGDCASELKDAIRLHKPALLDVLQLTFLIVRSDLLNSIVFFVPDDPTNESLVAAGAEPGSIYTKEELRPLVEGRVTGEELRLFHQAKQGFNGKIADL
jgi:hypothetical protein